MSFGFGGSPPGLPPGMTAEDLARLLGQPAPPAGGGFGVGGPVGGAPQGMPQPAPAPFGFGPMFPSMPQGGPAPVLAENEAAVRQAEASMMPAPQPAIAENEAAVRRAEASMMPPGFAPGARPQMQPAPQMTAQAPQYLPDDAAMPSVRVPLPPARPAGFGFGPITPQPAAQADMPAVGASPASMAGNPGSIPTAPAGGAPSAPGGGFLSRLGDPRVYNTFLGVGAGLLSAPTFSQGLAAGVGNVSKLNTSQSAQDLAQAEFGLKTNKLRQEQAGNNATLELLARKGYAPNDARAMIAAAGAGHGEALTAALNNITPKADAGFRIDPATGVQTYAPGGPQDPNTIRAQKMAGELAPAQVEARAAATARGTAAGTPDADFTLGSGQVRYGSDGKVIAAAAPSKAEGFDMEKTLRNDFNKGLGSFTDVHDGYGRVLAATKLRETAPDKVTPASDMSLVFGFMKMLDPTSVVREGEYATAKNATGVPERILNMYNAAKSGEFLTMRQRQDLVSQAQELYNTARGNAEGLSNQYRGIAGRYGVNPDNVIALPAIPAPRNFGNTGGGTSTAPASMPDRSAIEAEMRRRGLR